MMSLRLKIDGYKFEFTVGGKDYCGVVIRPDNTFMAEKPYRKALRKAFDCIPILEASHDVTHWAACTQDAHELQRQTVALETRNKDAYDELKTQCLLVINQNTIALDDHDIECATLILAFMNGQTMPPKAKKSKSYKKTPGFVYLIKGSKGYKIGMSKTPLERITTLGVVLPFPIETLAVIETDDMVALERQLHKHYDEFRLNGEWFDLRDDHVEDIQAMEGDYNHD
jgi:hypothetical protein